MTDARKRLASVGNNEKDPTRSKICGDLIEEAEQAALTRVGWFARPREYLAWDCLAQFDRHIVFLLSATERAALWESLKAEADWKLDQHRKDAVRELGKKASAALDSGLEDAAPPAEVVYEVMKLLQTTSQNTYHKIDQLRRQIDFAGILLMVLVVALLAGTAVRIQMGCSGDIDTALLLGTVMGLTGGALSLAFSVTHSDVSAKIPAMRSSFEVARIRPFIGAAIALPVILIFESGLINIPMLQKNWIAAVACFFSGFSERWFLGLVEKVEKKAGNG
jgi:hypothetical protein